MITIKSSLYSILYMEDLIKKAEEYDIDINYLIFDAVSRKDPGGINLIMELAEKYIAEAEDY